MKKLSVFLASLVLALGALVGCGKALPKATYLDATLTGTALFATNNSTVAINPNTEKGQVALLDYLGRKDVVYVDARELKDFEAGHIEGFECIPFFSWVYCNNAALDATSTTLFKNDFTPRYSNSADLMRNLLPEGKVILLMCQSGGRIQSFMQCLKVAGYDMTKIYNVGGWGQVAAAKTAGFEYPTVAK